VKRHHVHALYGFCRHADDIVDDLGPTCPVDVRAKALADFGDRFFADLEPGQRRPVLKAVVHTVRAFDIDPDCFRRFLRSMAMDLTVDHLRDLGRPARLHGRLGRGDRRDDAAHPRALRPAALQPARDLGNAFQLTNFLRDVAEDLDRGRVYLPQEDLRRFGADPALRRVDPGVAPSSWRSRSSGAARSTARPTSAWACCPEREGRCIESARVLYSRILDVIEAQGYDVFTSRARCPPGRS
jgi:15-cis-phytoene synthase